MSSVAALELPVIPDIPAQLECIKLRDCFPYRRLYPAFHHLTDSETGTLDYASEESRELLGAVEEELHMLGFRKQEVIISAAAALVDLASRSEYANYVEEPGDLFAQA